MGSYLTIVNNTPDRWHCKIGPDKEALWISIYIVTIVSGVILIIGAFTGAAPMISAMMESSAVAGAAGLSAPFLATMSKWTTWTNFWGTVAFLAQAIAGLICFQLGKGGYNEIQPGESHRYGKMSLSLWQQGECIRTTVVDESTVYVDTVLMHPILSGSTINSNRNHEILYWLNHNGSLTHTELKTGDPIPVRRKLEQKDDLELFTFYPDGRIVGENGEVYVIKH